MKLIYKDFTKNLTYYLYVVLKGDLFKDDDLYYFDENSCLNYLKIENKDMYA